MERAPVPHGERLLLALGASVPLPTLCSVPIPHHVPLPWEEPGTISSTVASKRLLCCRNAIFPPVGNMSGASAFPQSSAMLSIVVVAVH